MASQGYRSPLALDRAISDRVRGRVADDLLSLEFSDAASRSRWMSRRALQLRRDLAIQRLLARLERDAPRRWVLKGGMALQLRLDPSRPSLDLDLADSDDSVTRELQVRDLERAADLDLRDYFRFSVDRRTSHQEEDGSFTVSVEARLGGKSFARFAVDIAPRGSWTDSQLLDVPVPFELELVDPQACIRVIRIERQIADKTCAIHEMRGDDRAPSSRWRDLADIAMMALQIPDLEAVKVQAAIADEAQRRQETLPDGLDSKLRLHADQLLTWPGMWGTGGREVPIDFDVSLGVATRFLDPLLAATATGTWRIDEQAWC